MIGYLSIEMIEELTSFVLSFKSSLIFELFAFGTYIKVTILFTDEFVFSDMFSHMWLIGFSWRDKRVYIVIVTFFYLLAFVVTFVG